MKYTNKHNLPDAFRRVIENDPYTKGEAHFSATGLINPARSIALLEKHRDEVEVDISTRVAATIGQGVHSVLERGARSGIDLIEERFYRSVLVDEIPYIVSAQIDLYESDTKTLYDWKTTKAYAFHKKTSGKKEWEIQLNIGAYLILEPVSHLKIIGLLKDWDKRKAKEEPGYPPTEVMTLDIPLWEESKTELYIQERIRAIVSARKELPLCTMKETWGGNRCAQWCDAATVCDQYKQAKQTGLMA